jgi:hypothetical protein
MVIVISSITVDKALISGLTPNLTMENTCKGKVFVLGPVTKKLVITSSIESVNERSAPATTPGIINGSVIYIKVFIGLAPRSIAASSMEESNPANLDLTVMNTKGILKVACDITSVSIPSGTSNLLKNIKRDIPNTISGITMGMYSILSSTLFPLNLYLYIPTPAKVPIMVESMVERKATFKELLMDLSISSLFISFSYQENVNPVHTAFNLDSLKENTINTSIGMYRMAKIKAM